MRVAYEKHVGLKIEIDEEAISSISSHSSYLSDDERKPLDDQRRESKIKQLQAIEQRRISKIAQIKAI
jgi:hypothetical protein